MKYKRITKAGLLLTAGAILLVLSATAPAFARCAMCKLTVENAGNNAALAKSLNTGILVMLVPPIAIFCAIFVAFFRYRREEPIDRDGFSRDAVEESDRRFRL